VVGVRPVDDRPYEPAGLVVEVDEALAEYGAVGERDDPVLPVEARVEGEAGHEALV
jgi:hypothetical protein